MSSLAAFSGGRFLSPPPSIGVTVVAATKFSGGTSTVCLLKMNPTSEADEQQVTGSMLTVTANANDDILVLPPVSQSTGVLLYIINSHDSHDIVLNYVAAGSVHNNANKAALPLGAAKVPSDHCAVVMCDGTKWYSLTSEAL